MGNIPELFLKQLRLKSGIPLNQDDAGAEFQPLYDDDVLTYILNEASYVHCNKEFMEDLSQAPYVFLLARKEIYTILASAFARSYDIGSRDGNLKKSQPHEHYMDLIDKVQSQYLEMSKSTTVRTTPVLLPNRVRYAYRNFINSPPPTTSLFIVDNQPDKITFKLSPTTTVKINSFNIYVGEEPVYDMFELPPISPNSSLLKANVPFTSNQVTIDKPANIKYMGIHTKNRYGKQYFLETYVGVEGEEVDE